MESKVYNQEGKEVGSVAVPRSVFGVRWNPQMVHRVVSAMAANARFPYAHTKDRGDVRGGGIKPWRQKGTGRARHGSRRSPLWRHGGVTFGPSKERNFEQKINKKEKNKALRSVLSKKMQDNEIIFLKGLSFPEIKTKRAKETLSNLGRVAPALPTKRKNALYISYVEKDSVAEKSFRNMGNVSVGSLYNLNAALALQYKYLVFVNPEKSFEILKNRSQEGGEKA